MKNLINYYYGILIDNLKKRKDHFLFESENVNYEFMPFYGDINQFYKNYLILINNNIYCHEVIYNKDKNLITFYNNKPYLLLKKNIFINKKVDLNEIINYDIPVDSTYNSLNWKELWKDKVDYYEYQMSQLAFKYKKLKSSFDYYIGLSETAISILNYIETNNLKLYICHKRIPEIESLDYFFNPINIVIDSRVRDIAEYIKNNYFNNVVNIEEVFYFLEVMNFDNLEYLLFLSRLLYPSYYFDMYDLIIQEKINEDKIEFYIKKNISYEIFLKKIYKHIKSKHKIPEIEWLEN